MSFSMKDQVVVITGGGGFFGAQQAQAVAEIGGIPILVDINEKLAKEEAKKVEELFEVPSLSFKVDITSAQEIDRFVKEILKKFNKIDVLINNAANNPKMDESTEKESSRLENFSLNDWNADISVGLTGAFLCSKIIGTHMADSNKGVILNIASDLGIIAPDQRIYKKEGLSEEEQPVKPVSYSVIKHALIGLTRYLATYWCEKGIRVNALCPGGIANNQPKELVDKLVKLIPMGRMAKFDDYRGGIQFLVSDASKYMTGQVLVMDGGRTVW